MPRLNVITHVFDAFRSAFLFLVRRGNCIQDWLKQGRMCSYLIMKKGLKFNQICVSSTNCWLMACFVSCRILMVPGGTLFRGLPWSESCMVDCLRASLWRCSTFQKPRVSALQLLVTFVLFHFSTSQNLWRITSLWSFFRDWCRSNMLWHRLLRPRHHLGSGQSVDGHGQREFLIFTPEFFLWINVQDWFPGMDRWK
jgi:hypothetical protein